MNEFIYIMINPSIPGLVKIGRTNRTPDERAVELSSTGVPTPFIVAYEQAVSDSGSAESAIHALLESQGYRPNSSREFFQISLKTAISIVSSICANYEALPMKSNSEANTEFDLIDIADDYYWKGWRAYYGEGDSLQSYPKALEYLELSQKLGNVRAAELLANIYLWGLAGSKNANKALEVLQYAANKGAPDLYLKLAHIYSGNEIDLDSMKSTVDLKNIGNSIKCYELFFLNNSDFNLRIEGLESFLNICRREFGADFSASRSWKFLDDEIEILIAAAREILSAASEGKDVESGKFLKILEFSDYFESSYRNKMLKNIIDGFGESILRNILKNLPNSRIEHYLMKFFA